MAKEINLQDYKQYCFHEAARADRIFRAVRFRGGTISDYDDFSQEAFLAACVAKEKYRPDEHPDTTFGTYLTTVLRSHFSNLLSTANRKKRCAECGVASWEEMEEDENSAIPEKSIDRWTPEETLHLAQLMDLMYETLEEMHLAVFLCITNPPPGLVEIAQEEAIRGRRKKVVIRVSSLSHYLEISEYRVRLGMKAIRKKFARLNT